MKNHQTSKQSKDETTHTSSPTIESILIPRRNQMMIMENHQAIVLGFGTLGVVLLLSLVSPATSCTPLEEASLLQFLNELSPAGPSHTLLSETWRNSTASCCAWEGVTCDGNGTVTELLLPSRGLEGNISASLGNLTGLRRLDLSRNSLSGGLPPELMSSASVLVLDVSFNRLSGELQEYSPSSLEYHPLQVLNVSSNFFFGDFPSTAWGKKPDLVEINASHNSFHDGVPYSFCFGSPSSFAVLDLSYNLFTGGIPSGIGECSALRVLKVGHNDIGGEIPDELFNATSLEQLSFPQSGLTGELRGELVAKLGALQILDLQGNNLVGEIPDSIGELHRLKELHLGRNTMRGELSKVNFSGLPSLEILDLTSNSFTGEIPESVYSCSKLTTLQLSSNRFHGQISRSLANLISLSFLSLANNAFKNITNVLYALGNSKNITTLLLQFNFRGETLPDDVTITDGFQSLRVLSLGSCLLSGNIPLWLSKLTRLEILDLANNRLTGPIPVWIDSLSFLYHLDLSNNRLTEDIPTAVMELPMLQSQNVAVLSAPISVLFPDQETDGVFPAVLNLSNNHLTGTIPSEIGQLKSLVVLNLSFNSLSGSNPQELCNLTNLQVVDLSHNHLTCSIPSALNNLQMLSTFDVSYNDLEGEIPTLFHTTVIVYGNQKLGDPSLGHDCASAVVSTLLAERTTGKIIFAISFGAFFFVGVLYDQTVLSRYLAVQTLF